MNKVSAFFAEVKKEAAKVTWPTRQETLMTAVMVVVLSGLMAVFFLGVDFVLAQMTRFLITLKI